MAVFHAFSKNFSDGRTVKSGYGIALLANQ